LNYIWPTNRLHIYLAYKETKTKTMKKYIDDKEFMETFVKLANKSWENYGSYEDVYMEYEDRMSDDEILELLDYCDENELLEL
jgi:SOS response regulatory protein OraA/RecX